MCSRGPLPLCGPLPQNLLPQASRCKGPQDRLLIAQEGGKMPLPHKWHTSIKQYGNNFYQNRQG